MKIHDISLTVTPSLPVWPGDPAVVLERMTKMEDGAHNNISRMAMGVHTGTHVDAPYHFIADGKTIENLDLSALTGPAVVVQIPAECQLVGAAELQAAGVVQGMERILLKTANNRYWATPNLPFQKGFVALSPDGANHLIACGVRLVGIDYFSIAPFGDSVPTHRALLGAEVVVVEGINLSEITPGTYQLYCLPLKLGGSDGSPARAILIEE
jgi:arylformamidase